MLLFTFVVHFVELSILNYLNSTTVSLNVDNITNFDFFFLKCFINGWIQLKNVRNRKPYLAVWDVYCLPINGLTAISLKPLKGRATTFISVLFWVTPDNFTQQSGTPTVSLYRLLQSGYSNCLFRLQINCN